MPKCMVCKESVISGYVLCPQCAKSLESDPLPVELTFVLDKLAEEIVLSETIPACPMCKKEACSSQVSGTVCRNGIRDWLMDRSKGYLAAFKEEHE